MFLLNTQSTSREGLLSPFVHESVISDNLNYIAKVKEARDKISFKTRCVLFRRKDDSILLEITP